MPPVKASARPNLEGWKPLENTPSGQAQNTTPAPEQNPLARSPFMHAAMPLMASTADAFTRQFYGKGNLPSQRILPAKKGAGA